MRLLVLFACLLPAALPAARAQHNPLIPQPQEIQYRAGKLKLRGLRLRFASPPTADDRFAMGELAAILGTRAETAVPIAQDRPAGPAIVLRRTGSGAELPGSAEQPGPESREAYTVKIRREGGEIASSSSTGLFYGVQTLRQLIEGSGSAAVIPEMDIHDWPAFAYRAVMMDMSHGALPTEEEVKRQIDFVARWKANQYYFYSEGSIELKGYPLLNPTGRFRQEQVRRIVEYARQRHIDVVPCLEFFGHLHDLFRIEHYADLAVLPHGQDLNADDPRVMTLLKDWATQLARLFPSPYMHIGFDEPYELERASKRSGGRPQAEIYIEHLDRVAQLVGQLGKRVVIWADMGVFRRNPDILRRLPPVTAVPWHNGVEKDYSAYLAPLTERNIPEYASTSVYGYYQIFPDFNQTFAALNNLMRDAARYKAMGLLLTLWTDDAQNLTKMSLPGVAYGVSSAWQSRPMVASGFFLDFTRQYYPPDSAAEVARALQACADAETLLQNILGEYSMLKFWADPLAAPNVKLALEHRDEFRQARILSEKAQEHLYRAQELGADPESLSVFLLGARMLDYAGLRYIYAAEMSDFWKQLGSKPAKRDVEFLVGTEINDAAHSRVADLIDAAGTLYETYRAAWESEYTPYRMRSALLKWDTECQYWWKMQRQLQLLLETFRDGDTLPPLESFVR